MEQEVDRHRMREIERMSGKKKNETETKSEIENMKRESVKERDEDR